MRNVMLITATGMAILLTLAFIAIAAGSSPAPSPSLSVLDEYRAQLEWLSLQPVPDDAPRARVALTTAVETAAARDHRTDAPDEVIRALVSPDESGSPRGAYVVIYRGGPMLPGGPEGRLHASTLSVIVIDDQTGDFMRGYYYSPSIEDAP